MPSRQHYTNMLIEYLALFPERTGDEIMDKIGVSKSTLHRIIRDNDFIIRTEGRIPRYSLDAEKFVAGNLASRQPKTPVNRLPDNSDEMLAAIFEEATLKGQTDLITQALQSGIAGLDYLHQAEHYALKLASRQAEPDVVQWGITRDKLIKMRSFGLMFAKYCEHYLDHPNSQSADWWTIFVQPPVE